MNIVTLNFAFIFLFFLTSSLNVLSNVDLPGIPKRPSLKKLKKSLNKPGYSKNITRTLANETEANSIRIKNLSNDLEKESGGKKDINESLVKSANKYDSNHEKVYRDNFSNLFAIALNAVMSLDLSLRSFNTDTGEIIASDKLKNSFKVIILNNGKNQSKVQVFGNGSLIGKRTLNYTSSKILAKISETRFR